MTSPWTRETPSDAPPGREQLPDRADVAVVGGGLAGCALAHFLAERGTDVVLLERRDTLGDAASGRAPGHVLTGLIEHPYRVVHALGEARSRELYGFCRENTRLLAELGLLRQVGGWWVATDAREPGQVEDSVRALERLGIPVELRTDADAALGGQGFGPAMHLPEDGFLDPAAAPRALAERSGARCYVRSPVDSVHTDARGAVVRVGGHELIAEVVVFAANAWLPSIDPWFVDKIVPFREQALVTGPAPPLPHPGGRAGYGYTFWRQLDDGRLVAAGCRWATPHMEVGETDDTRVVGKVQDRIEAFVGKHLGLDLQTELPVEGRWSWIAANSCDGLPIVGPLPGSPRLVSCAGFCGNEAGLAVRAARGVADGLLHGVHGVPSFLAASRFL